MYWVGAVAVLAAVLLLLRSGGDALAVALEILLVLAGLDLAVTGPWGTARCTRSWVTRPPR